MNSANSRGTLCSRTSCPYATPCHSGPLDYVLRVAPVGVTVTCLDDRKVVWSNGVAPVPSDVLERDSLDLVDVDDRAWYQEAITAAALQAEPQRVSARASDGDGGLRDVQLTVTHTAVAEPRQVITFWSGSGSKATCGRPSADPAVLAEALGVIAREVVRAGFIAPELSGLSQLPGIDRLDDREMKIVTLLAQGLPSRAIGAELFISGSTVRNHLGAIYRKLGVANHAELMQLLDKD
jgi:DNA-binding CsgD family transcriptional regulator